MTDYASPTVVQTSIPKADMTPLERYLLARIFDEDDEGETVFLSSCGSPNDTLEMPLGELRAAFSASQGIGSLALDLVAVKLDEWQGLADGDEVQLDLSMKSYEFVLQDIVKRSPVLNRIEVVTSYTCTKMRRDGFGGAAMAITAGEVRFKSTDDILNDFRTEDDAQPGEVFATFAVHSLLRLSEDAVRCQLPGIIETDPELGVAVDEVTAADIRAACTQVAEVSDLADERGFAEYKAAVLAIRLAKERQALA
ncbi:hypothetical protein ABI_00570 [Asticcacaulis biprosthecium C19]|uniref:Uncharacterized protein n=1 Tax=Asticcacaulis biprosthecium C19 TaxID=715226 RepID=F4QG14_9CAUL|nr:hypothetical protein [Asticcacaulis biprosthecium]EGF93825.1 hypothetical protein ABI_00570 [Asticcacaulis biprosthecium C19]